MMKLFIWKGEGVLKNYSTGMAIAYAASAEEARANLYKELTSHYTSMMLDEEWIKERLAFLEKSPIMAFPGYVEFIEGSD